VTEKKGDLEFELEISAGSLMLEAEGRVWAIRPEVMAALGDLDGRHVSDRTVAALQSARTADRGPQVANGVAVIPLQGMITPQPSLLAMLFGGGGGGLMGFRSQLRQAVADPDVSHIVMDVDSPGGLVDQVPEVAAEIRQAREAKPIVAVANTMAASAAYWLASQAHEVVVTPSGEVGSIGVYQLHKDISQALAGAGIKPTLIHAGKYKVEGNPYEPLDGEALQSAQEGVNDYYGMFLKDVGAGRAVDPAHVEENYGQGRTMTAQRAVRAGLADRVATLGQTIQRLSSGRAKVRRTSADDGLPEEDLTVIEATAEPVVYTAEEKDRVLATLAALR
jgi:signal peptide peptidase SppA